MDEIIGAKIPKIDLNEVEDFSIDIDIDDSVKREENIIQKEENKKQEVKKETEETEEREEISDIQESEEFDANEVLDIESMLFEKADIKLDKERINAKLLEKEYEEEKMSSKKVDLTKVSNLIMELPKKPTKGKDFSVVKVPNYIKDMIHDFFSAMAKQKTVEKDGATYKESKIKLEVVDVSNNEKYVDKNAKILSKTVLKAKQHP